MNKFVTRKFCVPNKILICPGGVTRTLLRMSNFDLTEINVKSRIVRIIMVKRSFKNV